MARALEHLKPPSRASSTTRGPTCSCRRRPGGRSLRGPGAGRAASCVSWVRRGRATCHCAIASSTSTSPRRWTKGWSRSCCSAPGYDTRAGRFADQLAGRPVFEVDLAAISRAKAAHHRQARGRVPEHRRGARRDRLRDAGAGPTSSPRRVRVGGLTFFVWEGVPMYLTGPPSRRRSTRCTSSAVPMARSPTTCGTWSTSRVRSAAPARAAGRAEPGRRTRHLRRASRGLRVLPGSPRLPRRRPRLRLGTPGTLRGG